jgi:hypothetical protein
VKDWVETAPMPVRTKGQEAPTAKALVATATAKVWVVGSWATMDQVMVGWIGAVMMREQLFLRRVMPGDKWGGRGAG